jgi:hypothetical protein
MIDSALLHLLAFVLMALFGVFDCERVGLGAAFLGRGTLHDPMSRLRRQVVRCDECNSSRRRRTLRWLTAGRALALSKMRR